MLLFTKCLVYFWITAFIGIQFLTSDVDDDDNDDNNDDDNHTADFIN